MEFADIIDWETVAIVKPFKRVYENTKFETTAVIQDLGGIIVLSARKICGLVGRIVMEKDNKKIYTRHGDNYRDKQTR